MPWSGGVYTRGYPSWTTDANNNLPISATKFDIEDNDFAAGLNNCLTIDGLNKPNATLSWAQAIALTRATDGTLLSLSRTGGATNPSITWSVVDSGNHIKAALNTGNFALDFAPSAYLIGNATDNPSFSFLGSGVIQSSSGSILLGPGGFGNSPLRITAAGAVGFDLIDTSGAANSKVWNNFIDATQFHLRILDDALGTPKEWGNVTRSTTSITQINWGNTTDNPTMNYATASAFREVGFRGAEQNANTTPYTLQQSDNGRIVDISASSGGTVTVPSLTAGTMITVVNGTNGTLTLAQSGVTLRLGNSAGTTGNRTLAQWVAATLYWGNSVIVYVFGGGVT